MSANGTAVSNPPILPNSKITPGKANPKLTKELICNSDFRTGEYRNVPEKLKNKVYSEYGIIKDGGYCSKAEGCEIDHLIPIFIGGSNDIKNLWPQSYEGVYSAHEKDHLEITLHKMMCANEITQEEAQKEISTDWVKAYNKYVVKK